MGGKLFGIHVMADQLPTANPMALLPIRFEEGREPQIKGQDGDCALFVGIHDELDGTEFVSFKLLNYDTKLTDTKLSPVHPLFSHAYLRDQAAKMT